MIHVSGKYFHNHHKSDFSIRSVKRMHLKIWQLFALNLTWHLTRGAVCQGNLWPLYVHDGVIKWKTFRVTDLLCEEFTGRQWIPLSKASDAGLWCLIWSAPEQTVDVAIWYDFHLASGCIAVSASGLLFCTHCNLNSANVAIIHNRHHYLAHIRSDKFAKPHMWIGNYRYIWHRLGHFAKNIITPMYVSLSCQYKKYL